MKESFTDRANARKYKDKARGYTFAEYMESYNRDAEIRQGRLRDPLAYAQMFIDRCRKHSVKRRWRYPIPKAE